MKSLLIPMLSLVWCGAIIPLGDARASGPEGWAPNWYQCDGYVKKWAAIWHTHPASGWPYKHLMKSPSGSNWVKHNSNSP